MSDAGESRDTLRVLVCGSRTYSDDIFLPAVVRGLADVDDRMVLIHGAARGADALAGEAASWVAEGVEVIEFPADWDRHGKRAGYVRNQQMLDEGKPEMVVAFVDKPLAESKGTAMMVEIARKAGVPVYVIQRIEGPHFGSNAEPA